MIYEICVDSVAGVRAALCADAETARGARKWNDANVLVMSLRATAPAVAKELIEAWLTATPDPAEKPSWQVMERLDAGRLR